MNTTTMVNQQSRQLSRLKGAFVSLYLMAATGLMFYSGYRLWADPRQWAWLGGLFATVPFMVTLTRAFLFKRTARTRPHMTANVIWGIVGILIAAVAIPMAGAGLQPLLINLGLLGGYVAYDYWYSDLGRSDSPALATGQVLPEFTLYRGDGTPVSSRELEGSHGLLIFFRGNWCPFCVAQIKEIVASYQALADRGVKVWFISPQTEKHTRDLARQFEVPGEFLSDRDNQVAEQLGIAAEGGLPLGMEVLGYDSDTVLPTAVLTDTTGTIIYSDQTNNYRVRPEPQEYLAILDKRGV